MRKLSIGCGVGNAAILALLIPVCAMAQGAVGSSTNTPRPQVYSLRDIAGWSEEFVLEDLRERAPATRAEAPVVTRAAALLTARRIADRRSTPALRAYLDTTRRDPNDLRKMAAYAAMNGGEGAMAFLLAADRKRAGDWATQYNIAAFLLLEGYPRASLAILDSLRAPAGARGPGGINLQAALLLGRGNAMVALGRPRQAIPLLREARRTEPMMSEAARSLARAHLLLNEEEEATRVLRTAGRRYASVADMEDDGRVPPITDPTITIDQATLLEALRERGGRGRTLQQRWPFHRGYGASLEPLPLPSSPELVEPFRIALRARLDKLEAQFEEATATMQTAAVPFASDPRRWAFPAMRTQLLGDVQLPWLPASSQRFPCADPDGFSHTSDDTYDRVAVNRAADKVYAEERLEDEDLARRTRDVRRAGAAMCERMLDREFWGRLQDELRERLDRCTTRACSCSVRRSIAGKQLAVINDVTQPWLSSVRRWYGVAHQRSTAVAGHIVRDDITLREMSRANIAMFKMMVSTSVHGYVYDAYRVEPLCEPEEADQPSDSTAGADSLSSWPDEACNSADGYGVKQDLAIAEVKLSCYELEVEGKVPLPLPGFSAIGSVTYAFGGENVGNLTIFTGAGIGTPEIGGVEVSGKAGTFVTFRDGEVLDGGVKLSAEASAGRVVKEVSQSFSAKEFVLDAAGSARYVSDSFLALASP